MGLTVRSSRCAAVSMIIFGFLIFIPSGSFIAIAIIYHRHFPVLVWWGKLNHYSSTEFIVKLSWHLGYTSLLALITMITGCIGCCASGHRAHRDMCLIVTLFIFSLIVAGLSAYTIYDFSIIIYITRLIVRTNTGKYALIFFATEGSLLGLAILVFLLSSWAIICCLASFCCHTEVEPEPVPLRQQMVGGQQGVMMQGAVMVPMMRADTMPTMAPPNPAMMHAVPVMSVHHGQGMPVVPVNQAPQQPSQAMPMQVVATPVVMNTAQECGNGTVA